MLRFPAIVLAATCGASLAAAQDPPRGDTAPATSSAPISDVRYEVTFTRATATARVARVAMTFAAAGSGPVLLSLPAWTPGAYEISNFARWIVAFAASASGRLLEWDKADHDTWRIRRDAGISGPITVTFEYRADTLDNAMAWARPDFLLFNGTNFFLYPEGQPLSASSRVIVRTEGDWRVATALPRVPGTDAPTFTAASYHELVDAPFFVGDFDIDSAQVAGKWMRFATYPAGAIAGVTRATAWDQLRRSVPPQVAVFGDVPWPSYTVLQIVDSAFGGASGLEHADSHVDVFAPVYIGSDFQPSLYAHEIFHAWNVKRLRPAEMWPYRYDVAQPTTWLWVSEGVTDYYADLTLVRGGIVSDSAFYALITSKIAEVAAVPPIALEDASLSTWLQPTDGTHYIYYAKGALAGFLLDIMIRDASDNRRSLDHVMREVYETTYKRGRGFTHADWWGAVSRAAGNRSFSDFERRYVDGREPYPWVDLLPRAGMRASIVRIPRLGIATIQDSAGVRIVEVDPGGPARTAGLRDGDYLLAINDLSVDDQSFGTKFRAMFADAREGQPLLLRVRRDGRVLVLTAPLELVAAGLVVGPDPAASARAARIRNGILRGVVDR